MWKGFQDIFFWFGDINLLFNFLYLLGKHLKKKKPHQSTLPLHEFVRLYILKHIVSLKLYLYLMYMGDLLHVYVK